VIGASAWRADVQSVDPFGLVRALRVAAPFGVALFAVLWIAGAQLFAEPGALRATVGDTAAAAPPTREVRSGVVLVPLGRSARVDARTLARELQARYGVSVAVRPRIDVPSWTLDDSTHQLVADELVSALRRAFPASEDAVVIGITDYDIESTSLGIQHMFAFSDSQHYAVVSSAQMGANGFDRVRGHSRHERVRKLVARELGFLYFKRSESMDPHSLLRPMMWRLHDIDALRERL
jgi:predicted Zn-dependent protease